MTRSLALSLLLAAGCAGGQKAAPSPTEVRISVVDAQGEIIPGTIQLWSKGRSEECEQDPYACTLELPKGRYSLTFRKLRAGRVSGTLAGGDGGARPAGCLRARIDLVPGQTITCKQRAPFNCAKGAYETMDCGAAAAARYGYKPSQAEEEGEP